MWGWSPLPIGDALTHEARRLGVSLNGLSSATGVRDEPELQRRVVVARRERRDARLWVLAVISAVAAVVSAVAAWYGAVR
jgi:hypothetical protein